MEDVDVFCGECAFCIPFGHNGQGACCPGKLPQWVAIDKTVGLNDNAKDCLCYKPKYPVLKAKDGKQVKIRPAYQKDMERLFGWQTQPEVRRFARNPNPPALDEHKAWFQRKMNDPGCDMFIILYDGKEAGFFRLDGLEDGRREVSIIVAPEMQGRGIGKATLLIANEKWPEKDLFAEVLPGNEASHRIFSAAGYEAQYSRKADKQKG